MSGTVGLQHLVDSQGSDPHQVTTTTARGDGAGNGAEGELHGPS